MYQQLTNPVSALQPGSDLQVAMTPMEVHKDDEMAVIANIQNMDTQSPDVLEPKLEDT